MGLAIGTRLGPYEIVAALGAGGMGEVYRAHDTKLGRDVVLKVVADTFAFDPDRLALFEHVFVPLAARRRERHRGDPYSARPVSRRDPPGQRSGPSSISGETDRVVLARRHPHERPLLCRPSLPAVLESDASRRAS
jgi:serine/threonine protein kinase